LTISEILNARYPIDKVNHWEIKCLYGQHEHFGIFWYKYGTPFDKEPVHGICFYYNEIPENIIKELTNYLLAKFSGKILRRQSRVFLEGSKVINDSYNIGQLANEISLKFSIPVEITLEFEKVTKEEVDDNRFNFPQKKALPIVGID
ncbi:MAG TPA: hypothetical protein VFY77_06710, partial [Nitrososphaeraceae archaeon]|nr:hypothetical protein [Nitrososphaeraceae archaeon]